MTILYLIRHAESRMNAEFTHLIGGRTNHSPLTQKGERQSHLLGERLKREDLAFDAIYASPAIRTMETARIACHAAGYTDDIMIDPDLQEVFQGDWEGLVRTDIYTAAILHQMQEKKNYFKAPNGESQLEVEQRMIAFIERMRALYPDGTVAAFTHGVAIKCLMRFVQDWNPLSTYHTEVDNTSISIIRFNTTHERWRLRTLNDHAHLL